MGVPAADGAAHRCRSARRSPTCGSTCSTRGWSRCPIGVRGRAATSAACRSARGYLNRAGADGRALRARPVRGRPRARALPHRRPGAVSARTAPIEYLGRLDFQVKMRGLRIELGEIEAALDRAPGGGPERGHGARRTPRATARLVAYVVPRGAQPEVAGPARPPGGQDCPPYMVPTASSSSSTPCRSPPAARSTARRLPDPGPAEASGRLVAPRNPTKPRSPHLARGARARSASASTTTSSSSADIRSRHERIDRMRRSGLKVDVRTIFMAPTVAELAAALTEDASMIEIPPNLIPKVATEITPEMRAAGSANPEQIRGIAKRVPGGGQHPGHLPARSVAGRLPLPPPPDDGRRPLHHDDAVCVRYASGSRPLSRGSTVVRRST